MNALLEAIAKMDLPIDAQRIFHGRGGRYLGCEHWVLDAFPPVFVATSFKPISETDLSVLHDALANRWREIAPQQTLNWVFQCRQEGEPETRVMSGAVPNPHEVTERGLRYRVHVSRGQTHGLFLDMAQGRQWVRDYVMAHANCKVLNLFAYTCAFSVVALSAGAKQVVNVDMSHGAMAIGQQNHALNHLNSGASFLTHDIFKTWGKISRSGPYHLVIVDPPSYQKGSFVATKDYAKLIKRLPDLLRPNGRVLLCLNAPELGVDFLHQQIQEHAPTLSFVQRVENPQVFEDVSSDRSLKVMVYQAPVMDERG